MLRELANVPEGGVGFATDRGVVSLWEPCSRVCVAQFVGFAEAELALPVSRRLSAFYTRFPRFSLFIDLQSLSGYDSEIRTRMTDSARAHFDRADEIHFVLGSKIVAMGVSVANLAVGGKIQAHTIRGDWLAALEKRLREGSASGFVSKVGLGIPVPAKAAGGART